MNGTEIVPSIFDVPKDAKLSTEQLAEALYEGSPHLEFLMHNLARQYRDPKAVLPPWCGQSDSAKDFSRGVATLMIKFSLEGHFTAYKNEEDTNG